MTGIGIQKKKHISLQLIDYEAMKYVNMWVYAVFRIMCMCFAPKSMQSTIQRNEISYLQPKIRK